jgi:hypothetical protein
VTVAKLVAIVATAFFFTGALCFDGNDTTAQARLIIIDKLIAKEKMEYARNILTELILSARQFAWTSWKV